MTGHYTQEFRDISVFDESNLSIDVHTVQLDTGPLLIRQSERIFPDLVVRRFTTNRRLAEEIVLPLGWTTFVLTPVTTSATWCGVNSLPGGLAILRSDREHCCGIPAGWSALEIDVLDEVLINEGIVSERMLQRARNPEKGQFPLSGDLARRLSFQLNAAIDDSTNHDQIDTDPSSSHQLRSRILDTLAQVIQSVCDTDTFSTLHRRYALVHRAQKLIMDNIRDDINIEMLAADLGTSPRSLQRAFKNNFSVSPLQFLLSQRLDAARREIRKSSLSTSITEIAYRYKFSSPSRFSEHYKRKFGELPSSASYGMRPRTNAAG